MLPFLRRLLYTPRFTMKWGFALAFGLAAATTMFADGGGAVPFRVGEKLSYQIFWGPFIAGRASLEVVGIEQIGSNACYHLVAEAHTSGLADMIWHVETKNESWLDVNELCSRQYRENRTEGKRVRASETQFDYSSRQASTTNFITGKMRSMPLDAPVQDMISSLYFVRAAPLALNINQNFTVSVGETNYTVNVRPDLRKTMYFRPTGDIPAWRIEPSPTLNVVAANKGRMWFWISDDARRLPLLVYSDMKIGSAKLVLYRIEGTNAPPRPQAATVDP
jgi:hypothetical protein